MRLSYALPQLDRLEKGRAAEYMARMAEFGYDGVEFLINDPAGIDRSRLRSLLRDGLVLSGLRTGSVFMDGGLSFSDRDTDVRRRAVERMKDVIAFAAEFETGLLLGLVQGRAEAGESVRELKKRVSACLEECLESAESHRVPLNLEPLNRYELSYNLTVGEVLEFLEPINASRERPMKLLLDTYHMFLEEDSIPAALVRGGGGIGHVHFSDSNRGIPGTGCINFPEVVKTLDAIGYDGWVTVEINDKPDIFTAAKTSCVYIRAIFDVVKMGKELKNFKEIE